MEVGQLEGVEQVLDTLPNSTHIFGKIYKSKDEFAI